MERNRKMDGMDIKESDDSDVATASAIYILLAQQSLKQNVCVEGSIICIKNTKYSFY